MDQSPIIYRDLGDGTKRRLFLSYDELVQIKREVGRGFYSLFLKFSVDAEPNEVKTIIRLALIGGGTSPKEALELVDYYCVPPRPLKDVYIIAYECLSSAWNGSDKDTGNKQRLSVEEMDRYFTEIEGSLLKQGLDLSALRGKSFADIQDLLAAIGKDKPEVPAPSSDLFEAIKSHQAKG